jgi:hypothetical protein
MAFPSSSAATFVGFSPLGFLPVIEKLMRNNHAMWEAQILFALRGAQVVHFLDPSIQTVEKYIITKDEKKSDAAAKTGDKPPVLNPEFEQWVAKDQ